MVIPLHRRGALHGGFDVLVDVAAAEGVGQVAGTVFSYVNRRVVFPPHGDAELGETGGVYLPAEVVARGVCPHAIGEAGAGGAGVVVYGDIVVVAPAAGGAAHHGAGHGGLEEELRGPGRRDVRGAFGVLGGKDAQVVCKADARVGDEAVYELVSLDVAGRERGHDAQDRGHGAHSRRPVAAHVAVDGVDVGLVEGYPAVDIRREPGHDVLDIFEEGELRPAGEEAARALEPEGVREVPEGDHGLYAALVEGLELLDVVGDGALVKDAAFGLDAAPLEAEAAALQAHAGHELGVLAPALPVHGGDRGVGAVLDVAAAEPVVPVVVLVTALDLRRRAGRAEQQAAERKSVSHSAPPVLLIIAHMRRCQKKNLPRCARMKVSPAFSKAAGCRGGAPGRPPQRAELSCAS